MVRACWVRDCSGRSPAFAQAADPSAGLYPAKRNEAFTLDRPLTPESVNGQYNNFYEFGGSKKIAAAAEALKTRPWSIKIDGLCAKPQTLAIDDLLKAVQIEERLYRHRCVEAWSMTIPWSGFALKDLVAMAEPTADAKYIRFETFSDPKMAPGQRQVFYPWPYVEGLTMAEATNDLAFMVTGAYGKVLGKQFGAPIRLASAVEIWLQVDQVDHAHQLCCRAAQIILAAVAGQRIRLLGQCESCRATSALVARQRKKSSARGTVFRHCCSMAMPSRSRASTKAWIKKRSTSERLMRLFKRKRPARSAGLLYFQTLQNSVRDV